MKKSKYLILISFAIIFSYCQSENYFLELEQRRTLSKKSQSSVLNKSNSDCDIESTNAFNFDRPNFPVETRDDLIWGINGHSLRQDFTYQGVLFDNPYYETNLTSIYEETLSHLKKLGVSFYRNEMHVDRNGELTNSEREQDLTTFLNVFSPEHVNILPMIFATQDSLYNTQNPDYTITNDNFDYSSIKNMFLTGGEGVVKSTILNTQVWIKSYNDALEVGQNFAINRGNYFNHYNIGNEIAHRIINEIVHVNNTSNENNGVYFYREVGGPLRSGGSEMIDFFDTDAHTRRTISTCAYVKGLIDGIGQNDSDAKFIINDTRTHFGYLKLLNLMDVNYDILGWNWYSAFGPIQNTIGNITNYGIPAGTNVYSKLNEISSFKPIWLTEINRTCGSLGGNGIEAQKDTLRNQMIRNFQLPNIKAYFVYELLDGGNSSNCEHNFGLITTPLETNFSTKSAYDTYKFTIEELQFGYHDFMNNYYKSYKNETRNLVGDAGIDHWALQFRNGYQISSFLNSFLAHDSNYFVSSSFDSIMNQPNEPSHVILYYVDKLKDGWSREFFMAEIASSQPFLNRAQEQNYPNTNNGTDVTKNFISHVFMKFLGRLPNPQDLLTNSFEGDENRDRRRNYILSVLNSEEHIKLFIKEQYRVFLKREAETSGVNDYYNTWIQQNWEQKDLIKSILNSHEFWRKSIMRGYCLRQQN